MDSGSVRARALRTAASSQSGAESERQRRRWGMAGKSRTGTTQRQRSNQQSVQHRRSPSQTKRRVGKRNVRGRHSRDRDRDCFTRTFFLLSLGHKQCISTSSLCWTSLETLSRPFSSLSHRTTSHAHRTHTLCQHVHDDDDDYRYLVLHSTAQHCTANHRVLVVYSFGIRHTARTLPS